jgi:hypothetical protein
MSHNRATCLAHQTFLDYITYIISVDTKNYEDLHYIIFFNLEIFGFFDCNVA